MAASHFFENEPSPQIREGSEIHRLVYVVIEPSARRLLPVLVLSPARHGSIVCFFSRVVRQPANKNVPTNPLLGGTVGSRGSSLMTATPKGDLTLIYLA